MINESISVSQAGKGRMLMPNANRQTRRDSNGSTQSYDRRLTRLEVEFSASRADLTEIKEAIHAQSERLSNIGRKDWGAIASGAIVILMIVGGVGGVILSNVSERLSRVDNEMLELAKSYESHRGDGHPSRTQALTDANKDRIMRLEDHVTKEMNVVRMRQDEAVIKVTEHIRREIDLDKEKWLTTIQNINRRIDNILDRQEKYKDRSYHWERERFPQQHHATNLVLDAIGEAE